MSRMVLIANVQMTAKSQGPRRNLEDTSAEIASEFDLSYDIVYQGVIGVMVTSEINQSLGPRFDSWMARDLGEDIFLQGMCYKESQ